MPPVLLFVDAGVACVDLDGPRVMSSQMGFTHFRGDRKMAGAYKQNGAPGRLPIVC